MENQKTGLGPVPNHSIWGLGFNGVPTVYLIVCERNRDVIVDHITFSIVSLHHALMYLHEGLWFIVLLLFMMELPLRPACLGGPEVMDGGQSGDPSAPEWGDSGPSSAARGDITKEALTPSCDTAKQTAGPWWAWENGIIALRWIDRENKAQFEPCVERPVSASVFTEPTTFYHVHQLSQAASAP